MATNITVTITTRTPARENLEKTAANALLERKISSDDYRALVKPNFTEADFKEDLEIAAKIVLNAKKNPSDKAMYEALAMGDNLMMAIDQEVTPETRQAFDDAFEKVLASVRAAQKK